MRDNLIFTNHAKSRMEDHKITPAMVTLAWHQGREITPPLFVYFKKLCKYRHQKTVKYYQYGRIILTVNHTKNGPVLITCTKQKK